MDQHAKPSPCRVCHLALRSPCGIPIGCGAKEFRPAATKPAASKPSITKPAALPPSAAFPPRAASSPLDGTRPKCQWPGCERSAARIGGLKDKDKNRYRRLCWRHANKARSLKEIALGQSELTLGACTAQPTPSS